VFGDLGAPELLIILAVAVLIFGGSKLPELARGSGRALRIFKAEVNAKDDPLPEEAPTSGPNVGSDLAARQAAERAELQARHESERDRS
jgi:sec-independent protein translocase protein TatA